MKTHIEQTVYGKDKIVDINPIKLQLYHSPLVITAREGQKIRLLKLAKHLQQFNVAATVLGWWELRKTGYIDWHGFKPEVLKEHDAVFFMSPKRVYPLAQAAYAALISQARDIMVRAPAPRPAA